MEDKFNSTKEWQTSDGNFLPEVNLNKDSELCPRSIESSLSESSLEEEENSKDQQEGEKAKQDKEDQQSGEEFKTDNVPFSTKQEVSTSEQEEPDPLQVPIPESKLEESKKEELEEEDSLRTDNKMVQLSGSTTTFLKEMPAPGLSKVPNWSGDVNELEDFLGKFEWLAKTAGLNDEMMGEMVVDYLRKESDVKFCKTFKSYQVDRLRSFKVMKAKLKVEYPWTTKNEGDSKSNKGWWHCDQH